MKKISFGTLVATCLFSFALSASAQMIPPAATSTNLWQGSGSVFALPPGISQSSPSSSFANFVFVQKGNLSVAVTVLQKNLIQEGYLSPTSATGYFGAMTQAAVEAAQRANGLPQIGFVTIAKSQLALFFLSVPSSFTPTGVGTTGLRAASLQGFLIQKGYLHIPTSTGYFGATTQSAVKVFQKANNLPQTGIVDQATFAAMNGK